MQVEKWQLLSRESGKTVELNWIKGCDFIIIIIIISTTTTTTSSSTITYC